MSDFAANLKSWIDDRRAQCAESRFKGDSAHCAHSARRDSNQNLGFPVEAEGWSQDARDMFFERLGIGEELFMATGPDSEAWRIACREAEAVMADEGSRQVLRPSSEDRASDPDRLAAIVADILGVEVWAEIRPKGKSFRGEPNWSELARATNSNGPQGSARCRICHHQRWWRLVGSDGLLTCGACHPPVPQLDVDWINAGPTSPVPVVNTSQSLPHEPSNPDLLALQWLGLNRPPAEEGS